MLTKVCVAVWRHQDSQGKTLIGVDEHSYI